jgi:osmotically-inducible protein OsmY
MKTQLAAVLFGVAVFTCGCAQSDAGVTASVKSRLVADDIVKARAINVDTQDHIVTLTGSVETPQEEAKAIEIARATRGVVDVVDRLTVGSPESQTAPTTGRVGDTAAAADRPAADTAVAANIKTRFLADPLVNGLDIDVDTRDRVVTLTGKVTSEAAKRRAVEIASRAEGVVRVEDKLTVQTPFPPR